jgi:uncharacterized protein
MDASLRERLARIYAGTSTIAVVGASGDPSKPANSIPRYLQEQGYRVIPVNPRGGELFGEPVARSLSEVDGPVDVVDVFRPADEAPQIAREAVQVGARVLWPQLGIESARRPGRSPRRPGSPWSWTAAWARPTASSASAPAPTEPSQTPSSTQYLRYLTPELAARQDRPAGHSDLEAKLPAHAGSW